MSDIIVRPEECEDFAEIAKVVSGAFRKDEVAALVERIRRSPQYIPALALVAEKDGRVVGHIMLSYVELDDDGTRHRVLQLSPLAVDPTVQGAGIGSRLVRCSLALADQRGEAMVVLQGSPAYYPRFGFEVANKFGVSMELPSWAPPEAAMAHPLAAYQSKCRGAVIQTSAFNEMLESDAPPPPAPRLDP